MTTHPPLPQAPERQLPFDPPPEYAALRASGEVVRVSTPAGFDAWLVSDYAGVREVLGDGRRFSARPGSTAHVMPGFDPESPVDDLFTRMDGPEHIRIRRNFAPQLSHPRRLAELTPLVQETVDDALDGLKGAAQPHDLHVNYSRLISTTVIAELIGVPQESRHLFYDTAKALFDPTGKATEELGPALLPLYVYMQELVAARRAEPGDDVVSRLIAFNAQAERPLSDHELIMMNGALFIFGFDVISSRLSGGLLMLLSDRSRWERLCADPGLAPTAAEEVVRFLGSPTGLLRQATEDTTVHGQPIAAGDYVVLAVQSANRDTALLPDGDVFDMARKPGPHLGFGHGAHACVAQQIARVQLTAALRGLATRVPSLRLVKPLSEIECRDDSTARGPAEVPAAWDEVLPR
ncbi:MULTISPECIES: cytochrome P450 [Streptomyces]|uniref:cytochrome P450 n=1 Tax=Streptomyces TaxID=1883 RepID=UPI00076786F9|nr:MULTISPECIES: cytochrome P450 [Streptomyces]MDN3056134.1 cytochrome P450 [Streptomyces sp. SRF1]GLV79768.1 cytochrome P450 [Streptomyces hygroscopicus subsp. hygroscopicus]